MKEFVQQFETEPDQPDAEKISWPEKTIELSGEERILKNVQKRIYQNEETGRKLWKYILKTAPDEEELLKYLENEAAI